MFAGCTQLKTIDLRNFNVPKYNNAVLVFRDCVNLETIYVATADTAWKANSGWDVFYNCEKLVGGTGTPFDSENVDISMAKVQDGYFTAKPFDITVVNASGGAVETDKSQAYMGDTVSLDFTSDDNMVFSHYTVTDKNGDKVTVNGDTFTMPSSDVTVTAVFREKGKYDINEDGVEDINDIAFIISACVGEVEMTASQSAKADLNGDGAVDAFDAAKLDRLLF
jgi:surface protein